MSSEIFRFMTLRPPERLNYQKIEREIVRVDDFSDSKDPENCQDTSNFLEKSICFYRSLQRLRASGDREAMVEEAKKFLGGSNSFSNAVNQFTSLNKQQPQPFIQLDRWISSQKKPIKYDELIRAVQEIFEANPRELVGGNTDYDYELPRKYLSSLLIATCIYPLSLLQFRAQLMRSLRLLGLLERIAAEDETLKKEGAVEKALQALVLLPSDIFPLPPVKNKQRQKRREKQQYRKIAREKQLQKRQESIAWLQKLQKTKDEISQALETQVLYHQTQIAEYAEHQQLSITDRPETNSDSDLHMLPSKSEAFDMVYQTSESFLASETLEMLSKDSKNVLKQLNISYEDSDIFNLTTAIDREIISITSELHRPQKPQQLVRIGKTYVPVSSFLSSPIEQIKNTEIELAFESSLNFQTETDGETDSESPTVPHSIGLVRPIGVADLILVEQEIQKYEAGEVAHIENVLQGEYRERKHRRATTVEETFFTETERTATSERDLQSSERFELQLESEQVINQETSKEAGITVTAKYGWIESTASGSYASDTAKEESRRAASSHSRDITERSVNRIQERVLERRSKRTVEEFEETNTHGIDNKQGEGHVIGIYRWVNKIYKAQMVNYGKRMMFEFVVPEPAAFFRHVRSAKPIEGETLEKPEPPGYFDETTGEFTPLTPEDITTKDEETTKESYLFWVTKYEVQDIEPPPPKHLTVGKSFNQDYQKEPDEVVAEKTEIEIPDGYESLKAWVAPMWIRNKEKDYSFHIFVGRKSMSHPSGRLFTELSSERGSLAISYFGYYIRAYAFNVQVLCQRTLEKYQEWQLDTYNAIILAYKEQKAAYDEQIAAAEVQEGIAIGGRNPLKNREIERTELKKTSISVITGQYFDLFDAMQEDASKQGYPQMDFVEAEAEGRYIQFFEQAFEWENMTYLFYPYFWGRKDQWITISSLDDEDPLFAQFLRAGAAQVKVPVRLGYEEKVCHFIETGGNIWIEGDPPHIEDEFCISLVDEMKQEQKAQLDRNKGYVSVSKDSSIVTGLDTEFTEDYIDRQITIAGVQYRIANVTSETSLILTENYRGDNRESVRYSLGAKFIDEPWKVTVPTSLVILQKDSDQNYQLPDWTESCNEEKSRCERSES